MGVRALSELNFSVSTGSLKYRAPVKALDKATNDKYFDLVLKEASEVYARAADIVKSLTANQRAEMNDFTRDVSPMLLENLWWATPRPAMSALIEEL